MMLFSQRCVAALPLFSGCECALQELGGRGLPSPGGGARARCRCVGQKPGPDANEGHTETAVLASLHSKRREQILPEYSHQLHVRPKSHLLAVAAHVAMVGFVCLQAMSWRSVPPWLFWLT